MVECTFEGFSLWSTCPVENPTPMARFCGPLMLAKHSQDLPCCRDQFSTLVSVLWCTAVTCGLQLSAQESPRSQVFLPGLCSVALHQHQSHACSNTSHHSRHPRTGRRAVPFRAQAHAHFRRAEGPAVFCGPDVQLLLPARPLARGVRQRPNIRHPADAHHCWGPHCVHQGPAVPGGSGLGFRFSG